MRRFARGTFVLALCVAGCESKPSSMTELDAAVAPDLTAPTAMADLLATAGDLAVESPDLGVGEDLTSATSADLTAGTVDDLTPSPIADLTPVVVADLLPLPKFTITITKVGSGTINGDGFDCGATCELELEVGTSIELAATPDTNFSFDGWGGACNGSGTCTFVVTQDDTVSALFSQGDPVLLVTRVGSAGTVMAFGGGINCGTDCTETYPVGNVQVSLFASPVTGTIFLGWSGDCEGFDYCDVTMSQSRNLTATFGPRQMALTVGKDGTGTGTITTSPSGIDCGATCGKSFDYDLDVVLSGVAAPGSLFVGWSGSSCFGTAPCTVKMNKIRNVVAKFVPDDLVLSVTKQGTGAASAVIVADVPGIACGAQCSAPYVRNTVVKLTATPEPGTVFTGWGGGTGCSGTELICSTTITAAATITASFVKQHQLEVVKEGAGAGTIEGWDLNSNQLLDCGVLCSTVRNQGSDVYLNVIVPSGSKFDGWTGACAASGTSTNCVVTMDQAKQVTARFSIPTFTVTAETQLSGVLGSGGTVTSSAGIDCGSDCTTTVPYGTSVTVTATPAPGYAFWQWHTGFTGGCAGSTDPSCTFTVTNNELRRALFKVQYWPLLLTKAGAGTGTVSMPTGGACFLPTCNAFCASSTIDCPEGTSVTLTATPAANQVFTGWSGGGCIGTEPCTVLISQAQNVTATFGIQQRQLTVGKTGAGTGQLVSTPPGIDCGSDCTEYYAQNLFGGVAVQAIADPGFAVVSWSNAACGAASTCVASMASDTVLTARIEPTVVPMTVVKSGGGTGTVTSTNLAGIACGVDCGNNYGWGTIVQLGALADPGSSFLGWAGGGCSGTSATCNVTMDQAREVVAYFANTGSVLDIVKSGNGQGTVTGTAAGNVIDCGTDCGELVANGTVVSLTATPAVGSQIAGWSYAGCPGTGSSCNVAVNAATTVTVTFIKSGLNLQVIRSGNGTVSGTGIDCGLDCIEAFTPGTFVTLTATPAAGHRFLGWGGACSGVAGCIVDMSINQQVDAIFAPNLYTLALTRSGSGSGNVSSAPIGINCGDLCENSFVYGTVITLTAAPGTGASFSGWTGAGCTGVGECQFTITGPTTIDAAFGDNAYGLTVSRDGDGSGTIDSTPSGIACPGDCSQSYSYGDFIELVATPAAGSDFDGWDVPGCTLLPTCLVEINGPRTAKATFTQRQHGLYVSLDGTGNGSVGGVAGIDCPDDCSEGLDEGTVVTLTATPQLGSTFTGWSDPACPGTGDCVVTMSAIKLVTANFAITTHTVTVVRGGETGANITIASLTPAADGTGLACGTACSKPFFYGSQVVLYPTSVNVGADTFLGWSGGGCTGTAPCVITLTGDTTVTATFASANRMFVTSTTHTGNLGGLGGADGICQARATEVGLAGTYKAWLSSATTSATSRLGTARGWVDLRGLPILDRVSDIAVDNLIYPPMVNEKADQTFSVKVATGTAPNGTFDAGAESSDCNGWTSSSASLKRLAGSSTANSSRFTSAQYVSCATPLRLYCFGTDRTTALGKANPAGSKRAFTSTLDFNPATGLAAADAICQSEATGAGLAGTYRALLATNGATPMSRFTNNPSGWRRIDGPLMLAQSETGFAFLRSAPNTNADDSLHFGSQEIWSGSNFLDYVGLDGSTCNNWSTSSAGATGEAGYAGDALQSQWRGGLGPVACNVPRRVVCLQD